MDLYVPYYWCIITFMWNLWKWLLLRGEPCFPLFEDNLFLLKAGYATLRILSLWDQRYVTYIHKVVLGSWKRIGLQKIQRGFNGFKDKPFNRRNMYSSSSGSTLLTRKDTVFYKWVLIGWKYLPFTMKAENTCNVLSTLKLTWHPSST